MILRRCSIHEGSAAVVAKVCVSCACSARQDLHLRVKEDNYTREKYINTAKEGFVLKARAVASNGQTDALSSVISFVLFISCHIFPLAMALIRHHPHLFIYLFIYFTFLYFHFHLTI